MRKEEIKALKLNDYLQLLEERIEAKDKVINGINLLEELALYKSELEKERIKKLEERVEKLDEATIAYHASNKGISNRALMLKDYIHSDNIEEIEKLETDNPLIIEQIDQEKSKLEAKKAAKEAAKTYLATASKSQITTLVKAKEMIFHLKALIED